MFWAKFIYIGVKMIKIFIDDREDNQRIRKLDKKFNVVVGRLEVGDILIPRDDGRTICIEVKTRQDFITSCNNRRIQKEAIAMKKKYPYSYIVVYNDGKLNPKYVKQTHNQRYGNIASLMLRYKVPLFWCGNFVEFTSCINEIITTVDKIDRPIDPPIVRDKDADEKINILIGIDGVGKKMAQKLLDAFGKPSNVFTACPEELDEIPRLSKKVKENILRL